MDRNSKIIIASAVAFIVVAAGIVIVKELQPKAPAPSPFPPWSLVDFNSGTLKSGNTSMNITGDASSVLLAGNSTHHVYLNFYPPSDNFPVTYDSAIYNKSGTQANETVNMTSIDLNVQYSMNSSGFTEVFTMDNTLSKVQAISMVYQVEVNLLTNVTVSSGDPHYPTNATLVPGTHGFTELYNFNSANIFAASFGNGVNCTFNWYSMVGILNTGSLTFASYYSNSTTLKLDFSGFSIPPDSSLTLGEMNVNF